MKRTIFPSDETLASAVSVLSMIALHVCRPAPDHPDASRRICSQRNNSAQSQSAPVRLLATTPSVIVGAGDNAGRDAQAWSHKRANE
jgi:hypothetical protein